MTKKLQILGSFGGTSAQPDYNQNDSTAADYIKNRPFYTGDLVETELVDVIAAMTESGIDWEVQEFDGTNSLYMGFYDGTLEEGKEYAITINGNQYIATATLESMGTDAICFGDFDAYFDLMTGSGDGSDFNYLVVYSETDGAGVIYKGAAAPTECKIYLREQELVKIDPKYLPEGGVGYVTTEAGFETFDIVKITNDLLENDNGYGGFETMPPEETPTGTLWIDGYLETYELPLPFKLVAGQEYKVSINDISYTSTAVARTERIEEDGEVFEFEYVCIGDIDEALSENFADLRFVMQYEEFDGGVALITMINAEAFDLTDVPAEINISCPAQVEVIHKIDQKFLPEQVQSNWNENDPEAKGYIENRPFYEDLVAGDVLLEETFENFNRGDLSEPIALVEGETYFITLNGEEYKCVAWVDEAFNAMIGFNVVGIGSTAFSGYANKGGNDEPFYLLSDGEVTEFEVENTGTYTFKIQSATMAAAKKIDKKFLPEDIGAQSDWNQNDESASDYIKNRPFYDDLTEKELYDVNALANWELLPTEINGKTFYFYETSFEGKLEERRYSIVINDEKYSSTAILENGYPDIVVFGDYEILPQLSEENLSEFTYIVSYDSELDKIYITYNSQDIPVNCKIYEVGELAKIDIKYLPANVLSGGDWNQNNERAIGYIENRTHYTIKEGWKITWSGNTWGKGDPIILPEDSVAEYYHISDFAPSNEDLQNSILYTTYSENGVSYTEKSNLIEKWEDLISDGFITDAFSFTEGLLIVREENTEVFGTIIPEIGTYFAYVDLEDTEGFKCHTSVLERPDDVKKLDYKYLPDSLIGRPGTGNYSEIFNSYKNNQASGEYSHAEGDKTSAMGKCSHAEGYYTGATADYSHAEGYNTNTLGQCSHAEGYYTLAKGFASHADGEFSAALTSFSVASGDHAIALGARSRSEGTGTLAFGDNSKATGNGYYATIEYYAIQEDRHCIKYYGDYLSNEFYGSTNLGLTLEGCYYAILDPRDYKDYDHKDYEFYKYSNMILTIASVDTDAEIITFTTELPSDMPHFGLNFYGNIAYERNSSTEGFNTIAASSDQHVQGRWNVPDELGEYIHIVGNGYSSNRSNAHTIDHNGNAWFAGDVYVKGTDQFNGEKLAKSSEIVSTWIGIKERPFEISRTYEWRADGEYAESVSKENNIRIVKVSDDVPAADSFVGGILVEHMNTNGEEIKEETVVTKDYIYEHDSFYNVGYVLWVITAESAILDGLSLSRGVWIRDFSLVSPDAISISISTCHKAIDESVIPNNIPKPLTAQVGQTIVVKTVDENGRPTSWECVDLPTGSGLPPVTAEDEGKILRIVNGKPAWVSLPYAEEAEF